MLPPCKLINCKLILKILEWDKENTLESPPVLALPTPCVMGNVHNLTLIRPNLLSEDKIN